MSGIRHRLLTGPFIRKAGFLVFYLMVGSAAAAPENGDALPSGEDRQLVLDNCTACHSTAIIRQQSLSRQRWDETITWMQEKQGLWDLEPTVREKILDYLSKAMEPESIHGPGTKKRTRPEGAMYEFSYPANPL